MAQDYNRNVHGYVPTSPDLIRYSNISDEHWKRLDNAIINNMVNLYQKGVQTINYDDSAKKEGVDNCQHCLNRVFQILLNTTHVSKTTKMKLIPNGRCNVNYSEIIIEAATTGDCCK